MPRAGRLSQEQIVFGLALLLCFGFAVALPGFLTTNNVLNLVRSVSILGILGVAMGLVVIGRGIDLSLVALMAVSVAWTLHLINGGMPLPLASAIGLAFSLVVGRSPAGWSPMRRYPAIFATLAMGTAGLRLRPLLPVRPRRRLCARSGAAALWLGQGTLFGIPVPILVFRRRLPRRHLFLRYAKSGRYLRAVGDNPAAARITGVPVRPIVVLQYVLSSLIGYMAGIVTAARWQA